MKRKCAKVEVSFCLIDRGFCKTKPLGLWITFDLGMEAKDAKRSQSEDA